MANPFDSFSEWWGPTGDTVKPVTKTSSFMMNSGKENQQDQGIPNWQDNLKTGVDLLNAFSGILGAVSSFESTGVIKAKGAAQQGAVDLGYAVERQNYLSRQLDVERNRRRALSARNALLGYQGINPNVGTALDRIVDINKRANEDLFTISNNQKASKAKTGILKSALKGETLGSVSAARIGGANRYSGDLDDWEQWLKPSGDIEEK